MENFSNCIDQSHNTKNWCIMPEFQSLTAIIHKSRIDVAQNLQGLCHKVC